jgi:uncharacterized protein YqjF (DUF2071 family)
MMHRSLKAVAHRPWPVPKRPWIMAQNWHDLLFAHWPVPAAVLRNLIPQKLALDLYDGTAWIGIVPFTMSGVRLRGTLALPGLSTFPELNVRTYVTAEAKPGVWFFSLDAANRVAVELARLWFHLPYFHARMQSTSKSQGIFYFSRRHDRRGADEQLQATYNAQGPRFEAKLGTLEYFLTERYCLYAQRGNGELLCGEIHHAPWKLQHANASFLVNTMTVNLGIQLASPPATLHFSKLQEMIAWAPQKTCA